MAWQEPSTGAAPSEGLTLHNLFTNALNCVGELEVASLTSSNSVGFNGKA